MNTVALLRGSIGVLVVAVGWELASTFNVFDARFVPALTSVLATLWQEILAGSIGVAAFSTISTALISLFVSSFFAVCAGVFLGVTPKVRDYCISIVEILRPIPSVALIPVFVLMLGINLNTIYVIVAIGCFWPVLFSALYGVRQVDDVLLDVARTLHLPKFSVLTKVVFPASLPSIAGGIRIALAISLISTVTCEMVLGFHGLGAYILEKERSFLFPAMYAGILMLSVCGLVVNRAFVLIEHKVIFWTKEKGLA